MALGKVKVQWGVGSARWDTKDKRARVQAFRVLSGVHGMEDGIPPKGCGTPAAAGPRFKTGSRGGLLHMVEKTIRVDSIAISLPRS